MDLDNVLILIRICEFLFRLTSVLLTFAVSSSEFTPATRLTHRFRSACCITQHTVRFSPLPASSMSCCYTIILSFASRHTLPSAARHFTRLTYHTGSDLSFCVYLYCVYLICNG
jgi:hypothetical protein